MFEKRIKNTAGYTLIELMVVISIITIILALSGAYIVQAKKAAYKITSKYDLHQFAKIEEEFYIQNERFIGSAGQAIRNDGLNSDFALKGFHPTKGVCVTIISGDPDDPFSTDNPFIAQSKHKEVKNFYEFNFTTRQMVEK